MMNVAMKLYYGDSKALVPSKVVLIAYYECMKQYFGHSQLNRQRTYVLMEKEVYVSHM